jgi:hypothetical protein
MYCLTSLFILYYLVDLGIRRLALGLIYIVQVYHLAQVLKLKLF